MLTKEEFKIEYTKFLAEMNNYYIEERYRNEFIDVEEHLKQYLRIIPVFGYDENNVNYEYDKNLDNINFDDIIIINLCVVEITNWVKYWLGYNVIHHRQNNDIYHYQDIEKKIRDKLDNTDMSLENKQLYYNNISTFKNTLNINKESVNKDYNNFKKLNKKIENKISDILETVKKNTHKNDIRKNKSEWNRLLKIKMIIDENKKICN